MGTDRSTGGPARRKAGAAPDLPQNTAARTPRAALRRLANARLLSLPNAPAGTSPLPLPVSLLINARTWHNAAPRGRRAAEAATLGPAPGSPSLAAVAEAAVTERP